MNEEQHVIRHQSSPGKHFNGEEITACQHIHVSGEKVFPRSHLAPLGSWSDAVTPKYVSYRLIGHLMTQVGQGTGDAIIAPAGIFPRHPGHESFHVRVNCGRPGYCRCLEPSNFWATSLRYHARIVSGLATQATSRGAFRP